MALWEKLRDHHSSYNSSWGGYEFQSDSFRDSSLKTSWWQVRGSPKSLQLILWEPWISVPHFVPVHRAVVEIFLRIIQTLTCWWRYRKSLKITKTIIIFGHNKLTSDFMAIHPNVDYDISVWTKVVDQLTLPSQQPERQKTKKNQPWNTPAKISLATHFPKNRELPHYIFHPDAWDISLPAAAIYTNTTLRHGSRTAWKQNSLGLLPQKHDHQIVL